MTLDQAKELIDLLLDKADQPYFTSEEKDKFLNLAISDFVNMHYEKMLVDEDSRSALSGLINDATFGLTKAEIIGGALIYNAPGAIDYPALSEKFDINTFTSTKGYWESGNQYVLPKQHLYVLHVSVSFYNYDEVLDSTGNPNAGVGVGDVDFGPFISVKNKSIRDYKEVQNTDDPFNKPSNTNPCWAYLENNLLILPAIPIRSVHIQTLQLPTLNEAFTGSSTPGQPRSFKKHYQREIAVEKMTRVDIGLMTPSS